MISVSDDQPQADTKAFSLEYASLMYVIIEEGMLT
jgi:hypothetical protein